MSFYSVAPFIKENYPQYYSVGEYPADKCAPFCKVDGEWGIFGNFGRTPLIVGGVVFKTSEQLFQLMKFKDADAVKAVYMAGNPKMTAKKWEKLCRREDWGTMIVDAMKYCLVTKYAQSAGFRAELERSKGLFIVEDQTTFSKTNPDTWGAKLRDDKYVGSNLLGRLLMELRDNGTLEYTLPEDAFDFLEVLSKMDACKITLSVMEGYFPKVFIKDLKKYFDVSKPDKEYPFHIVCYLSLPEGNNSRDEIKWGMKGVDPIAHRHMFSAVLFHASLYAQVVGKLYGLMAMEDFHKLSEWPMMCNGMAGQLCPPAVVKRSGLWPADEERDMFKEIFCQVQGFMKQQFLDFLNVYEIELDLDLIFEETERLSDEFMSWTKAFDQYKEYYYIPISYYTGEE